MKLNPQFLLLTGLLLCVCCKKNDSPEPNPDVKIHENAIVVNDETNQKLTAVDSTHITYSGSGNQIDEVKIGSVLVSAPTLIAPFGYLRKVTQVVKQGSQTILTTEQAQITDVIEEGKVKISKTITPNDTLRSTLFEGNMNLFLFDIDNDTNTIDKQIKLSGSYSLGVELIFDLDIQNSHVMYSKIGASFIKDVDLNLTASGQLDLLNQNLKVEVFNYDLNPQLFYIGAVPIVLVPNLYSHAGLEGEVEASVTYGGKYKSTTNYYAEYFPNTGWDFRKDTFNQINNPYITCQASLSGKAFFDLGLKYKFYGLDSNYVDLKGELFLKGEAQCTTSAACASFCDTELKYGAKIEGSLNVDVLGILTGSFNSNFEFSKTFYESQTAVNCKMIVKAHIINSCGYSQQVHFEFTGMPNGPYDSSEDFELQRPLIEGEYTLTVWVEGGEAQVFPLSVSYSNSFFDLGEIVIQPSLACTCNFANQPIGITSNNFSFYPTTSPTINVTGYFENTCGNSIDLSNVTFQKYVIQNGIIVPNGGTSYISGDILPNAQLPYNTWPIGNINGINQVGMLQAGAADLVIEMNYGGFIVNRSVLPININ